MIPGELGGMEMEPGALGELEMALEHGEHGAPEMELGAPEMEHGVPEMEHGAPMEAAIRIGSLIQFVMISTTI